MARTKLSRREKKKYLSQGIQIDDVMNSLEAQHKLPRSVYKDVEKAVAIARKFNEEVIKPVYKETDLKVQENNEYLCWDFVKKANEWGLYSLFIPKVFGGSGLNMHAMYPFIEEISSVCVAFSNVIGVHYLGVATLCSTFNARMMNKLLREVKKGEKTGESCLISLAITEPEAGTDVEETLLVDRARIGTIAKRVKGGYIVNGRKIFISMGHMSTWHMLICYEDRKKPSETTIAMAVKNGMKGFSFGCHEKKMGQKACVASELIFENCFVPDKYVCLSASEHGGRLKLKKSIVEVNQQLIDYVVSATRAGVAAFATGCARGAYETALEYARTKKVGDRLLINHQWAQSIFSDMYKNVNTSRAIYLESSYANSLKGMIKIMFTKSFYYAEKFLPGWYFTLFISPFCRLKLITWIFRKYTFDWYTKEEAQVASGWGSLVKFACSDLAIENSQLAIEIMGIDGCRHDIGVEKFLRDAKLLQIYEGTNQLNRINLFQNLVGRNMPEVEVF